MGVGGKFGGSHVQTGLSYLCSEFQSIGLLGSGHWGCGVLYDRAAGCVPCMVVTELPEDLQRLGLSSVALSA